MPQRPNAPRVHSAPRISRPSSSKAGGGMRFGIGKSRSSSGGSGGSSKPGRSFHFQRGGQGRLGCSTGCLLPATLALLALAGVIVLLV
ncbi:MAG: hypothetical protein ACYC4R_16365 [Anaerolineae bacterium]